MSPCTATPNFAIQNHRLQPARWQRSENQDDRDCNVRLIVIHNISLPPSQFGGDEIVQLFTNTLDWEAHPYFKTIEGIKVSSHLLIRRDGEIIQFVDFNKRAWHAGESSYCGVEKCNDFAIGIELEGADDITYTEAQYAALLPICALLQQNYPIEDIVGHNDISPGRKTDPGEAFDWKRLDEIKSELKGK